MEKIVSAVQTKSTVTAVINFMPVGTIMPFAGDATTATALREHGWLLCNGATLTAEAYPHLFQVLANTCGGIHPQFRLPNLSGSFLRGVDVNPDEYGISRDPDADKRQSHTADINVGNKVLSRQDDVFKGHNHRLPNGLAYVDKKKVINMGQELFHRFNKPAEGIVYNTDIVGGAETRPINVSVNYIIFAGLPKS